jgi:peptide deformylase
MPPEEIQGSENQVSLKQGPDHQVKIEPRQLSKYWGQLISIGDPILRRKLLPVEDFSEAKAFAETLTEAVREIVGAGLAANQLGIDRQVAVCEVRKTEMFPDRPESPLLILVNPEIVFYSSEKEDDWEGCFSVPGYVGLVPRASKIRLRYQALTGEKREEDFEGYLARVIQHEVDHLNGHVYIDHLRSSYDFISRRNYVKFVMKKEATFQTSQK